MTEHRGKPLIVLSDKHHLDVYLSRNRQDILKELRRNGRAMTAKALADRLNLSPSSARHHLLQLASIGLVELDRIESINGIQARFYKANDVDVSIGNPADDAFKEEREAILMALVNQQAADFFRWLRSTPPSPNEGVEFKGDMLGSVIHLEPEAAWEFYSMVRTFLDTHSHTSETSVAWDFSMMFHRSLPCIEEQQR